MENECFRFAAALGLGFLGLLRPVEITTLKLKDIVVPSLLLGPVDRLFLQLGRTKTSLRGGALHQHVRIDDSILVPFVATLLEALKGKKDVPLLPGGAGAFRRLWDSALEDLRVPHTSMDGLTPASLRAGGATHLFANTQDIGLVKWRGRWTSDRTLETYLQELGSASVVPKLNASVRQDIYEKSRRTRSHLVRFASSALG